MRPFIRRAKAQALIVIARPFHIGDGRVDRGREAEFRLPLYLFGHVVNIEHASFNRELSSLQGFRRNHMARVGYWTSAIALAALMSTATFAAEPSFDCGKATHAIEKLVCGDDQLAGLDRTLADDFKKAMEQVSGEDQSGACARARRNGSKAAMPAPRRATPRPARLQSYKTRIAVMGAKYGFAPIATGTFVFTCDDAAKTSFYATFFDTDPPAMNLVSRRHCRKKPKRWSRACRARVRAMKATAASSSGTRAMMPWSNGRRARISTARRTARRSGRRLSSAGARARRRAVRGTDAPCPCRSRRRICRGRRSRGNPP